MEDIIKIVKALEDPGLLLEGVSERIKNEAKEQKGGFLSMLLGTLGSSLLGDMLAGKGIVRVGYGSKGKGIIKTGYGSKKKLIPPHPLTNFEIQNYFQNEPRFNGIYSRDNLHEFDIGTHRIALYISNNKVTYSNSFGVEHFPKEIKKFTKGSSGTTNIFRIQAYDSVMCGYICIGFIDFMLKDKSLTDFTDLFSTIISKE